MSISQETFTSVRERLSTPPAPLFHETVLERFFDYKRRYWFEPLIATHRAWLVCLVEAGAIGREDARAIADALEALERDGRDALEPYEPAFEYFYLHVERALVRSAGEAVVGNLNLGRTRPEPLTRMTLREQILNIADRLLRLREELLSTAEREIETVLPGYTHCQHGQPTTLGHYLTAVVAHLERDVERLLLAYANTNRCTLGSGALAGIAYPVDRRRAAELLGFDGVVVNTYDCVASMDHKVDALSALANAMAMLSRFAQDLHQWCTQEYGFAQVDDSFASISSFMPQKKNSLVFEYVRAHAAAVSGALNTALTMEHNTFFQDVEDVCIDVELPIADAFDTADDALGLLTGVCSSMEFDRARMLALADQGFSTASELADAIHLDRGISYRTAHRIVARVVQLAFSRGVTAAEVEPSLVDEAARSVLGEPLSFTPERLADVLDATRFVRGRRVEGAANPEAVQAMLDASHAAAAADRERLTTARDTLARADRTLRAELAAV